MTRTLTPWFARIPGLMNFEMDFPKWMAEVLGPEAEIFGRETPFRFLPKTNVAETEKTLEVAVEIPGMKPEEVRIEIREGSLWITGEKKEEKEEKGKTFHRVERCSGMFRLVLPLPVAVKAQVVDARFTDGVLKITLPKTEHASQQIEIKR